MRRSTLLLLVLVGSAGSAQADLCAWNTKANATKAVTFLKVGTTAQEYCKPCNDTAAKKVVITSVGKEVIDKDYDRVLVNGKGIDLAYFYVKSPASSKTYMNLGLLVKCEDVTEQDSPRTLPSSLEAK